MASIHRSPNSPHWLCSLTLASGKRTWRSTYIKASEKTRAQAMAECERMQRAQDLLRSKVTGSATPLEFKSTNEIAESAITLIQKLQSGELTEAMGREFLDKLLREGGLQPIQTMTTEAFLKNWMMTSASQTKKGTELRYSHTIHAFLAHLGARASKRLDVVTIQDIESFRDAQQKTGKAPATVNTSIKVLRSAFNDALRVGLILKNPAAGAKLLEGRSETREPFTTQQIRAMLQAADIEWKGMILISAHHGLRIGDAAKLTWENFNADRMSLRYFPDKTAKKLKIAEEVPLHEDVLTYLHSLPSSDNPKAALFPVLSKKRVSGKTGLSLTFRDLMRRAGIIAEGEGAERKSGKGRRFFSLGFHSLRHTAISRMANAGVSEERRMKLASHKSKVHQQYTHHELETLRGEVSKLDSLL